MAKEKKDCLYFKVHNNQYFEVTIFIFQSKKNFI